MQNIIQEDQRNVLARFRHPRVVFALTGCVALIGSNSLALSPISPAVAEDFAVSVPFVMAAAASYGLGTACGALFLARHIDRLGAQRAIVLALVFFALSLLFSALALRPWLLITSQAAAGLAAGVALPAIYARAAEVSAPERAGETIGFVLTGWTLSMIAGVSLSAVLAEALHWRVVFGAIAGLAAVAAAALARGMGGHATATNVAPSPWQAARLPGVARLLIICAAYMISFYGVYAYLGDHVAATLRLSTAAAGLITLAYGLGFGLAALLDGVIDKAGPARAMPPAFAAIAAIYAALALGSGSYLVLAAIAFVWGLLNHFGLNVLIMRLSAIAPAQRGTVMGLNSAVTYLCVFLGTLGFAPLYQLGGFSLAAGIAALLCLAGAALARSGRAAAVEAAAA